MEARYYVVLLISLAGLSACHRNTNGETSYMRHLSVATVPPTPQPLRTSQAPHVADSTYRVLYRFADDVGSPNSQLLFVNDGLYGTTFNGVYPTSSTVFRIGVDGRQKILYQSVPSAQRFNPSGGLVEMGGTFYSASSYGGMAATRDSYGTGKGVILTFNKKRREQVLYAFKGAPDGAAPSGGLIYVDGKLYGTTSFGGSKCVHRPPGGFSGCGTVYSISPNGAERVLYSFGGGEDGANPNGSLINVNGTLYGTTPLGGGADCAFGRGAGCGTVYRVSTNGKETVLYRFASCCRGDGAQPNGRMINVNGTLYGTTHFGGDGDPGFGTIYSVTLNGAERVLYTFRGTSDGFYPSALIALNGKLYGTTEGGGDSNCGTLYSLIWFNNSAPAAKYILHTFACGSDGAIPESLINVHGVLYGTTSGQANSTLPGRETIGSQATIFSLTPRN